VNKIPQWVFAVCATIIGGLFVSTMGLVVYVFTSLSVKVDKLESSVFTMSQALVVLQAQVDTQGNLCRFTKKQIKEN